MPTLDEIYTTLAEISKEDILCKRCAVLTTEDYRKLEQHFNEQGMTKKEFPPNHEYINFVRINVYRDDTFGKSFSCNEAKYLIIKTIKQNGNT